MLDPQRVVGTHPWGATLPGGLRRGASHGLHRSRRSCHRRRCHRRSCQRRSYHRHSCHRRSCHRREVRRWRARGNGDGLGADGISAGLRAPRWRKRTCGLAIWSTMRSNFDTSEVAIVCGDAGLHLTGVALLLLVVVFRNGCQPDRDIPQELPQQMQITWRHLDALESQVSCDISRSMNHPTRCEPPQSGRLNASI